MTDGPAGTIVFDIQVQMSIALPRTCPYGLTEKRYKYLVTLLADMHCDLKDKFPNEVVDEEMLVAFFEEYEGIQELPRKYAILFEDEDDEHWKTTIINGTCESFCDKVRRWTKLLQSTDLKDFFESIAKRVDAAHQVKYRLDVDFANLTVH